MYTVITTFISKNVSILLVLLSLFLAVTIRVSNFSSFDEQNFIGPDSARFIRQIKLISENGHLSSVDEMRSAPLGRLNCYELTFFQYLVVWVYNVLRLIHIQVELDQIIILSQVIFFCFALLAFYFLIKEILGKYEAILGVNIAAVLPVLTVRTMAGYVDRDATSLFLGLISYYLYVKSYHTNNLKHRLLLSVASGLSMGALGITWQGVAIFSIVIVCAEFARIIMWVYDKNNLYIYICWSIPMLLVLLITKRSYYHLNESFAFLAVVPPLLVLLAAIVLIIGSMISRIRFIMGGLLSIALVALIIVFWSYLSEVLTELWKSINNPFGTNRLMELIGELKKQGLIDWYAWPGIFFFAIAGGLFRIALKLFKDLQINEWYTALILLLLVSGIIFSRVLTGLYVSKDTYTSNIIFSISLLGLVFLAGTACIWIRRRKDKCTMLKLDYDALFLIIYFLAMLICARSAIRFSFFLAPIEIALGSFAIVWLLRCLVGKSRIEYVIYSLLFIILVWEFFALYLAFYMRGLEIALFSAFTLTIIVIAFSTYKVWVSENKKKPLLWKLLIVYLIITIMTLLTGPIKSPILLSYTYASCDAVMESKPFVNNDMQNALMWLKNGTPSKSIVAASWEWGSCINLLGERRTIVDEAQIIPWVNMMSNHVFSGYTQRELLEFLKAHNASHLLITARDINLIQQISYTGSDESSDRQVSLPCFGIAVDRIETDSEMAVYRYRSNEDVYIKYEQSLKPDEKQLLLWQVVGVYLKPNKSNQLSSAVLELRYENYIVRRPPRQIILQGKSIKNQGDTIPCTLLINADSIDPYNWAIIYLSEEAENNPVIQLYLLDNTSKYFHPVYPAPSASANEFFTKIWEIRYPQDIKPNPKYLENEFICSYLNKKPEQTNNKP